MTSAGTDTHSSGTTQGDRGRGNRGASPSPRCQFCRRMIRMTRSGAWYHDHNASEFCSPGTGSGRKAVRGG